ncbi:MAG: hypothetical protein ACR2HD_03660 [Solirubrobacteraceae bacterium]|nr:MAG: hypothetical protein DLM63_12055 [Solirubrobacterales bacterium]
MNAPAPAPPEPEQGSQPKATLKRVGVVSLMTLASVNVWTGSPLMALWVGSKVQGSYTNLSMTAVAGARPRRDRRARDRDL